MAEIIRPIKYVFTGDDVAGKSFIKFGRTQLGILERQMELGKLQEHVRRVAPYPGVRIECFSSFGHQEVNIHVEPWVAPDVPVGEPWPREKIPKLPELYTGRYIIAGNGRDRGWPAAPTVGITLDPTDPMRHKEINYTLNIEAVEFDDDALKLKEWAPNFSVWQQQGEGMFLQIKYPAEMVTYLDGDGNPVTNEYTFMLSLAMGNRYNDAVGIQPTLKDVNQFVINSISIVATSPPTVDSPCVSHEEWHVPPQMTARGKRPGRALYSVCDYINGAYRVSRQNIIQQHRTDYTGAISTAPTFYPVNGAACAFNSDKTVLHVVLGGDRWRFGDMYDGFLNFQRYEPGPPTTPPDPPIPGRTIKRLLARRHYIGEAWNQTQVGYLDRTKSITYYPFERTIHPDGRVTWYASYSQVLSGPPGGSPWTSPDDQDMHSGFPFVTSDGWVFGWWRVDQIDAIYRRIVYFCCELATGNFYEATWLPLGITILNGQYAPIIVKQTVDPNGDPITYSYPFAHVEATDDDVANCGCLNRRIDYPASITGIVHPYVSTSVVGVGSFISWDHNGVIIRGAQTIPKGRTWDGGVDPWPPEEEEGFNTDNPTVGAGPVTKNIEIFSNGSWTDVTAEVFAETGFDHETFHYMGLLY